MKKLLLIAIVACLSSCETDPYEEGIHWDYNIFCEDGFKYKALSKGRGTIPVHNSDGTKLKCNQIKY